jgi:hypothetical protein
MYWEIVGRIVFLLIDIAGLVVLYLILYDIFRDFRNDNKKKKGRK